MPETPEPYVHVVANSRAPEVVESVRELAKKSNTTILVIDADTRVRYAVSRDGEIFPVVLGTRAFGFAVQRENASQSVKDATDAILNGPGMTIRGWEHDPED